MKPRLFRQKKTNAATKAILFTGAVLALLILINLAIGAFETNSNEKQLNIAKDAITRAAVQCYSVESRYQESLDYLVENYGIVLDTEKYIYHYRATASNLLPEVDVFPKKPSFVISVDADGNAQTEVEG